MHKCNCGKVGNIYVASTNRYYCDLCFDIYKIPKGFKASIWPIEYDTN